MTQLLNQIIGGLANGAIYAALALALVMIYRATGIINFAQGEMAMLSTYAVWLLISAGLPVVVAVLIAVAASAVVGGAVEQVVMRPSRKRPEMTVVMITLGLFLAFNSLAAWVFGPNIRSLASPFPEGVLEIGEVRVGWDTVGTVLTLVGVVALLALLLKYTKFGLRLRAAASNPDSAELAGIDVGWTLTAGWALAAAVGAVSGALVAPAVFLEPNMMLGVLIYALAAAALGGFDSPAGAVVGGLVVGLTERLAGAYLPFIGSDLKILVPLVLIFAVLAFRPAGLFGTREIVKV